MAHEVISKKIEQIKLLLSALEGLLNRPLQAFIKDDIVLRAAERNFELIVELASDINTQLLIEKTGATPDSYKQSFSDLGKVGIIDNAIADALVESAKIRNILVHEYDFEEDYEKFYEAAKRAVPVYHSYLTAIYRYLGKIS